MNRKRKVCFVITSYIHYARGVLLLEELKNNEDIELSIVIGGTALLPKYSAHNTTVREFLEEAGYTDIHEAYFAVEGDVPAAKAKTTGHGVIEFSSVFAAIEPDVVVVRADRFEMLSAAIAAAYMNISVAHIEGGDTTGTLDESIRHAITKLAHIHFPSNEIARERLISMGEHPENVFNFGSTDVEVIDHYTKMPAPIPNLNNTGFGAPFFEGTPYLIVMYHPVWNMVQHPHLFAYETEEILESVNSFGMQVAWILPNFDVGGEEIARTVRMWDDETSVHRIRFLRYLPPEVFLPLLNMSSCLIGNSSAGLKEASRLGVPVVNVGTRQMGRLHSENVKNTPVKEDHITATINSQLAHGRYEPSDLYAQPDTAKRIAQTVASHPLVSQKIFYEYI